MIARLLFLMALLVASPAAAQVSAGTLVDLGVLQSRYADPRRVTVWLPSTYRHSGPKHAVLYMHDGQNLFDKATAGYGMEWQVDETLDPLIRDGKVRPTIVVGIWNTDKRLREYVPAKAFDALPPEYMDRVRKLYGGDPLSDGYLKFITAELMPQIEARYRVARGRKNTFIMGSSMGALISLYAINEYPQLFAGAGMVSTHWPLMIPTEGKTLSDKDFEAVAGAFESYLSVALPKSGKHRLYFDHGTETLDHHYAIYQARIDRLVALTGFRRDIDVISRNFPGQAHNEISWASRLEIPLRFLLAPRHMRPRAR